MYNPNQRKPSNKKKKRKLKRKAFKMAHKEERLKQRAEQGPKITELAHYALPYPLKLNKVGEYVDHWYNRLELDFVFREVLLDHNGWFPVSFAHSRLGKWTNHAIIINAFLKMPDRYNVQGVDDTATLLPPLPDSFAQEADEWRDYEYNEEDFHEEHWSDWQTDLDEIRRTMETQDDSNEYDALLQRDDYPFDRIKELDEQVKRQAEEERQQYPRLFGDENERNPCFGYDGTIAVSAPKNKDIVWSDLRSFLSKRKQ